MSMRFLDGATRRPHHADRVGLHPSIRNDGPYSKTTLASASIRCQRRQHCRLCRPREGGDPASFVVRRWIPAPDYPLGGRLCAGMTATEANVSSARELRVVVIPQDRKSVV